jgi:hypothetical protein
MSWKKHINTITGKLNKACYIIRKSKWCLSYDTLKMVYYAFSHSIMFYRLIFWDNSTHSKCVFWLQKTAAQLIGGAGNKDSCRETFKLQKILPLSSQYIYSLVTFVVNNKNQFVANSNVYSARTRTRSNLHLPLSNLSLFQKGPKHFGIKVYNNLPDNIKQLSGNKNQFKKVLLQFLHLHSFHSIDEFLIIETKQML